MSLQKKEALKKILTELIPYRDIAEWFLLLLNEETNNELIEKLYKEILKSIREINSKAQQEQIKTALQKLKDRSEHVTKIDEEEADQMLNDFIDNI